MLEPEQLTGLSGRWYGEELRRAATLLDKAQIAVYPVDARGLAGSAMSDVTFTGRDIGGHLMSGPRLARELASRANLLTDSHAAMLEIANETGGRAYYNRNDIDRAVALAMEDGSTYYTLAYYPENKNWNGKYRKIKVELSRPGLQARHRHGYLALDIIRGEESRKQAVREIDAALVDPILHTMVGFYAAVAPPSNGASPVPAAQPSSPAKQKARVRFKVDPQTITFKSASDGLRECSLEFVIAAVDKSKIIAQEGQTIDGKLTQETYNKLLQQGLTFTTEIELPSAPSHFRLLVRDNHTGLMGTLDVPYTVTAAAK